jgi:hypothetical protein
VERLWDGFDPTSHGHPRCSTFKKWNPTTLPPCDVAVGVASTAGRPGRARLGCAMSHQPNRPPAGEAPSSLGGPRPALTVQQAAQATRVSRSTIKRRLAEQAFPNAYRADGRSKVQPGSWLIPVTDLIAAGYRLHAPGPAEPAHDGAGPPDEPSPEPDEPGGCGPNWPIFTAEWPPSGRQPRSGREPRSGNEPSNACPGYLLNCSCVGQPPPTRSLSGWGSTSTACCNRR